MEPVQGEGGIYPATEEFIKGVRALCDERDIVLIFDEIQCGVGRTGYMYAWQKYGVKPDILTSAKAVGNGVPVGAFMMTDKMAASSLEPGDHGTTYGGNPFIGTAVDKTLEIMERDDIFAHVREISTYLEEKLDELVDKSPVLTARRGMGLMQGVVCTVKVSDVVSKCIENGLIVLSAGSDVIRLVPPLIIEKEHVDKMVAILGSVLESI
jgi:acetylornithine/N-succinyldiaminopimelate aminotransferase